MTINTIDTPWTAWRDEVNARSVDEVRRDYADTSRFLVEGLIHATTTMVYGLSEVGKSWLMVDLVSAMTTGHRWLGQRIEGGVRPSLVLAADAGGIREYADRLGEGLGDMVLLGSPPGPDVPRWQALAAGVAADDIGLVIVDNLYAWAGAVDTNSNAEVARPLACLGAIADAGVAVVLVHHTNSGGGKPAGVHSIPAFFRHSLHVIRDGVRSHGNDAPMTEYWVAREGGRVMDGGMGRRTATSTPAEADTPAGRPNVRARHLTAVDVLAQAPPGLRDRAYGRYLRDHMNDVSSEDAGVGLIKTLRRKGLWPPASTTSVPSGG
ncbi:AAA family ATPase [Geodermatophilus sp. SYSU D00867]